MSKDLEKAKAIDAYVGEVWCDNCKRGFASLQYFSQHIFAPKNISCFNYFIKSAKNESIEERALKRRKFRERREAIIRGGEVLMNELKAQGACSGDGVFDFVDPPREETFPRVHALRLKNPTQARGGERQGDKTLNQEQSALNGDLFGQDMVMDADSGHDTLNEQNDAAEREAQPNRSEMEQFKSYVEQAHIQNSHFSPEMKAGIELMHSMNRHGGSLELYDDVSRWHVHHSEKTNYVTAQKLHNSLIERYNLEKTLPKERTVLLPHSKEEVRLATHDVRSQTTDLLTDPRFDDNAYLFFDDDPQASPPEAMELIGDINTSKAYRETYKKLIEPEPKTKSGRQKVLLPYIFYLDGCVTGQFQNLAIEILKFTLGLFKAHIRNEAYAWRNVGLVKKVLVRKNQAEKNIRNSGHVDCGNIIPDANYRAKGVPQAKGPVPQFDGGLYQREDEDAAIRSRKRKREETGIPEVKAQDFHKMLQVLLSSYKAIEDDGGIEWDMRHRAKNHRLLFIPFVIFCKADSVEADKICGTYGSKTEGVQCVCRACTCPTNECSNPYLHPPPPKKTPAMIRRLVKMRNDAGRLQLKKISQHGVWNAMYELRFGLHDDTGVHGAIPWDTLHWIQLNWYKTTRECLFAQTGDKSELSRNLDSLCITVGKCLRRQSDRDMPRTMFNGGVRESMLQAHHMTGVILVLAISLRSTQGRKLLLETARGTQKQFFNNEEQIRNWIQLLETLLMFESWLQKDEFNPKLVQRAKVKVKEVMAMTKAVGQRTKGMGDNRGVFHGAIHIPEMIQNFGAPKHFNTQFNEKDHKLDKKTAKRTQQRIESFDMSVATKIVQRNAIDLAMFELKTGRKRWHYFRYLDNTIDASDSSTTDPETEPVLTGTAVECYIDKSTGNFHQKVVSRSADKADYKYDEQIASYLAVFVEEMEDNGDLPNLTCYGQLRLYSPKSEGNRQIYHAEPFVKGTPWHDWGIFEGNQEVGEPRILLGQIKCFLDFRHVQEPEEGDASRPKPGIYAIIEYAVKNSDPNEQRRSDLIEPWVKKPSTIIGLENSHCDLKVVEINRLRLPAVVVPDLANPNKRAYLRIVPRWQWQHMFDDWLEEPHRRLWDAAF